MESKHPQRQPRPNDPVCWCGAWKSEHTGPDKMCKYNKEEGGCDCGGFDPVT